jgi:hypothetical protein
MTDFTDPVDPTHQAQSLVLTEIRNTYADRRIEVSIWEPRPCPSDWSGH